MGNVGLFKGRIIGKKNWKIWLFRSVLIVFELEVAVYVYMFLRDAI